MMSPPETREDSRVAKLIWPSHANYIQREQNISTKMTNKTGLLTNRKSSFGHMSAVGRGVKMGMPKGFGGRKEMIALALRQPILASVYFSTLQMVSTNRSKIGRPDISLLWYGDVSMDELRPLWSLEEG
jgi:hypothetical protein